MLTTSVKKRQNANICNKKHKILVIGTKCQRLTYIVLNLGGLEEERGKNVFETLQI
jgi:hypothetical protein